MVGELWNFLFRANAGEEPPSWENVGNTEGLPIVERKGVNGYHRAFVQLPGAKREWFFVRKTEQGFEPVDEERLSGIGIVEPLREGGVRARIFRNPTTGQGAEEEWVELPRLS